MKTTIYTYQPETVQAFNKCPERTISQQSHRIGMINHEPLIVIFDSFLAYAKAYKARFEGNLASDYILGDAFIKSIQAAHELLNGDGAVAMASGRSGDSKSSRACESIYQAALSTAGFDCDGNVIEVNATAEA
jgi:hypothetical protein